MQLQLPVDIPLFLEKPTGANARHLIVTYFMEQFKLGDVPTQNSIDDKDASIVSKHLPDLDAKSPEYENANLQYDATKED